MKNFDIKKINSKITLNTLLINFIIINIFGIIMVYSTTYKSLIKMGNIGFKSFIEQLILLIIMIIGTLYALHWDKNGKLSAFLNRYIEWFFYFSLLSTVLVLIPGVGKTAGGADSVLGIGPFHFQPLELYKITMIMYIAKYINNNPKMTRMQYIWNLVLLPGLGITLIFIQPDAGGAMILGPLLLVMLLVYGHEKQVTRFIVGALITLLLIGSIAFVYIDQKELAAVEHITEPITSDSGDYQLDRLTSWFNPFDKRVRHKGGNNLIQSYVSISNGGLLGSGYTNSMQKTGFLFAPSTDFIFAIIAEEFGILGVLFTIIILLTFVYQIFIIGLRSTNYFNYYYCIGYAALILIQSFINIGGVTGVIPMTGVTLPFISQGINSYMLLAGAFVYVLLIAQQNKRRDRQERRQRA